MGRRSLGLLLLALIAIATSLALCSGPDSAPAAPAAGSEPTLTRPDSVTPAPIGVEDDRAELPGSVEPPDATDPAPPTTRAPKRTIARLTYANGDHAASVPYGVDLEGALPNIGAGAPQFPTGFRRSGLRGELTLEGDSGIVWFAFSPGIVWVAEVAAQRDELVFVLPHLTTITARCARLRPEESWTIEVRPDGPTVIAHDRHGRASRLVVRPFSVSGNGQELVRIHAPRGSWLLHARSASAAVLPPAQPTKAPGSARFRAMGPLPKIAVEIYDPNRLLTSMPGAMRIVGNRRVWLEQPIDNGAADIAFPFAREGHGYRLQVTMADGEEFESTFHLSRAVSRDPIEFTRSRGQRPLRFTFVYELPTDLDVYFVLDDGTFTHSRARELPGMEWRPFVASVRGSRVLVHDEPGDWHELLAVTPRGEVWHALREEFRLSEAPLRRLEFVPLPQKSLAFEAGRAPRAPQATATFELRLQSKRGTSLWLNLDHVVVRPDELVDAPTWRKFAPRGWEHGFGLWIDGHAPIWF